MVGGDCWSGRASDNGGLARQRLIRSWMGTVSNGCAGSWVERYGDFRLVRRASGLITRPVLVVAGWCYRDGLIVDLVEGLWRGEQKYMGEHLVFRLTLRRRLLVFLHPG